tara:strand:- start:870 stop:2183 length:1314 start_codon:yes stop_codon:yes gene_type:complete
MNMYNLKLWNILIFFFAINFNLFAQEISESEIGFEAELIDLGGLSCLETFNNKNKAKHDEAIKKNSKIPPYQDFKVGKNIRGRSLIFLGEGMTDISAKPQDSNYIDAIQNAVVLAGLRAKTSLAEFRSAEIKTETIDRAMEAISSGVPVSDYGERQDALDEREENYNNMGVEQKFIMFINRKLDDWIGEKEAIAEDKAQLEKELENVLSQSAFGEVVTTLAYSEIAGMKNAQIQIKKDKVCVLSVWTDRTKRWANELGESDYKALANLRPGKSDYQQLIPNKQDKSGLAALTASYGLQVGSDTNGELFIISYAQASAIDRSASSINSAKMIAETRARGQIAQFQNEAVDVFKNLENIELTTTYKDGTTNNYSERNFTARTKAASSLNIAGVEQYDWWAAMHPFSQKPVVGAILVWQPSFALIIDESTESDEYDYLDF